MLTYDTEQMIFESLDSSCNKHEDTFFSVFHTQVPPEDYENHIQNVKQGMWFYILSQEDTSYIYKYSQMKWFDVI